MRTNPTVVHILLFLLTTLVLVRPSSAEPQESWPLSSDARASIITVLPGEDIHALFGHTAIRIHDPGTGIDAIYNYGTFDFTDPLFVPRFVYGQMDYFLSIHGYQRALEHYRDRERRPVIEQRLNLSYAELDSLHELLRINALPENRVYRYDFFFDNCSTRPRDVVEQVLGPRLQYGRVSSEDQSFRQLLAPYIAGQPFLRAGINVLLGAPSDRPATARETMFLPLDLFEMFKAADVVRDLGPEPLVIRTDTVAWVEGYERQRTSLPWALVTTIVLLLIGMIFSWIEVSQGRTFTTLFDAFLLGIVGLIGVLILFMWFVSEHTVTGPNLNLFWAWPMHLFAAYLIQRGRAEHFLSRYLAVTAVATAVFAAFWFLWPQSLPIAFLPIAVLLAVRAGVLWVRHRHSTTRATA